MPLPQSHPSSGPPWTLVCSLEAAPLKSEFRVLPRTNTSSLSHAVIRFIWIFSINFNPLLLDFHLSVQCKTRTVLRDEILKERLISLIFQAPFLTPQAPFSFANRTLKSSSEHYFPEKMIESHSGYGGMMGEGKKNEVQ